MGTPDFNRYRSRTYWLCWGVLILASALCYFKGIDGAGWVTTALGTVAAWQARRAWDNKLDADVERSNQCPGS